MLSGANNAFFRSKSSVFRQAYERAWSNLRPFDRLRAARPQAGQAAQGKLARTSGQVEHEEKIEGASGSRDRLVRPLAQRQKKKTLTDRGMVASEGQSLRE